MNAPSSVATHVIARPVKRALSAYTSRVWQVVADAGPQGKSHAEIVVASGQTQDAEGSYVCSEALKALRRTDHVWYTGPRGGKGVWIATGKIPLGHTAPAWFSGNGLLPRRTPGDEDEPTAGAHQAQSAGEPPPGIGLQLPVIGECDIDAIHRRVDGSPWQSQAQRVDYRAAAMLIVQGEPVCALRSDGRLEITTDDQSIELDQQVTRHLFRYLDRISAAGLAQRLETQSE